jgi:hypothetical protein
MKIPADINEHVIVSRMRDDAGRMLYAAREGADTMEVGFAGGVS